MLPLEDLQRAEAAIGHEAFQHSPVRAFTNRKLTLHHRDLPKSEERLVLLFHRVVWIAETAETAETAVTALWHGFILHAPRGQAMAFHGVSLCNELRSAFFLVDVLLRLRQFCPSFGNALHFMLGILVCWRLSSLCCAVS